MDFYDDRTFLKSLGNIALAFGKSSGPTAVATYKHRIVECLSFFVIM